MWHVLLVAPLAVPAFVNSYGWVSLTHNVEGFAGAVLIVTLSYYPWSTCRSWRCSAVSTRRSRRRRTPSATVAGATFRRVVLPQLRPAMLGGSLLVGLHLLAEFGALQMLRFPTFTTAIYDQYRSTFNGPAANMIASVLVLCCVLLLTAELRLRGHRRYARVGRGAATARRSGNGWGRCAGRVARLSAVVVLALGVPTTQPGPLAPGRLVDGVPRRRARCRRAATSLGLGAGGAPR